MTMLVHPKMNEFLQVCGFDLFEKSDELNHRFALYLLHDEHYQLIVAKEELEEDLENMKTDEKQMVDETVAELKVINNRLNNLTGLIELMPPQSLKN